MNSTLKQAEFVQKGLRTGSTILNNKYELGPRIGHGSFGQVFKGFRNLTNKTQNFNRYPQIVAIKVQKDIEKASQLANQIRVLNELKQKYTTLRGFPKLIASGIENGHPYIITDILGPTIQDLLTLCGSKFTMPTAIKITIQILQRIQQMHDLGYVYRDVKPQNFMMGIEKRSHQLFIVDFGLSRRYKDKVSELVLPYHEAVSMVGTIVYSSLNSHLGIQQTRRDDLQSIFYLFLYMYKGTLPWQGIAMSNMNEKDHLIMDLKLKSSVKSLCQDLPEQLVEVYQYIKNLDFFDNPDYKYISNQLYQVLKSEENEKQTDFDWINLPQQASMQRSDLIIRFAQQQSNRVGQTSSVRQDSLESNKGTLDLLMFTKTNKTSKFAPDR